MSSPRFLTGVRQHLAVGTSLFALLVNLGAPVSTAAQTPAKHPATTTTPIQHVIVIIGENRTFDHVFATYQPASTDTIQNLLSEGIVNADGTPGPNFSLASQSTASDTTTFQLSPSSNTPYAFLPPVLAGGYTTPPFKNTGQARKFENGLPSDYYVYLTTGGTGLNHGEVDIRVPNPTTKP